MPFVEDGDATTGEKEELLVVLDKLQTETEYTSWETSDPRTVNITHVRAECVRLAGRLRRAGVVHDAMAFWIDGPKEDPMPEVRFALSELE